MAQTTINIRIDAQLKKDMEETCRLLGMNMTTAFTIFARKMTREKRIPFEVSATEPQGQRDDSPIEYMIADDK